MKVKDPAVQVPNVQSTAPVAPIKGLDTVQGLAGTYRGSEGAPIREISMNVPADASGVRAEGTFTADGKKGKLSALADNAAFTDNITLMTDPRDPRSGQMFAVDKIWRDDAGKISKMQLVPMLSSSSAGAPFTLTRTGDAAPDPAWSNAKPGGAWSP